MRLEDGPFVDSNVLLYLLSDEEGKSARAETLLRAGVQVSVQALNEFVSVSRRKFGLSWPEAEQALADIRRFAIVHALTLDAHLRGVAIAKRYRLHIYDALIVAVAAQGGGEILYSEDLQDGQKMEGMIVRNPFR